MVDREKVVDGLQEAAAYFRSSFDAMYGTVACEKFRNWTDAIEQVIALLKAQEPRVMKVGDVRNWVNSDRVMREPVVIEIHGGVCAWIIDDEVREIPGEENLSSALYGKTWRCWTSRPDEIKRAETPWE